MQSLLQAVGVGAKNSLPAAAGINWVLKDGLGRLGRLSVSTRFGTSFDSDLKVSSRTMVSSSRVAIVCMCNQIVLWGWGRCKASLHLTQAEVLCDSLASSSQVLHLSMHPACGSPLTSTTLAQFSCSTIAPPGPAVLASTTKGFNHCCTHKQNGVPKASYLMLHPCNTCHSKATVIQGC